LLTINRDLKAIWHPFTLSDNQLPIPIVKASGSLLYTYDGKTIIDAISSWWVNIHGHNHPLISEALKLQLEKLHHVMFSGFTHEPAIELAEKLLTKLPEDHCKIFFSDNGSTAVEVAIKQCIQYWSNQGVKRGKIIALSEGYHGDTFGAMATGSRSQFVAPFADYLFEVIFLAPLDTKPEEAEEQLSYHLKNNDSCCFIFEPLVQGAGGMLIYRAEVLDRLIAQCHHHGVPTIADEVMTGFGRTGKWFASDYLKNKPDLICLSKGLTGGSLPLGVTSCTAMIWDEFKDQTRYNRFLHGHSFTANPLACVAANASFNILDTMESWQKIDFISTTFNIWQTKFSSYSQVNNPRSIGGIFAFDLNVDSSKSYFNPIRDVIMQYALECGVLIRPLGNVVYVIPPYCITASELQQIYDVLIEVIEL
jgi:adenosylmethionine---8-amino-7-oxononanoate aminotransferase